MKNYCLLLGIIISTLISLNPVVPTLPNLSLSFLVNTVNPCLQKSNMDLFLENSESPCITKSKRQINGADLPGLKAYEMKIKSNIHNRFAHTVVTTTVVNTAATTENKIFSVILPYDAFVTDFIMDIDGQNYTSYVVDNDEARKQFGSALADGLPGGYVAPSARDSNIFIISINVNPNTKVSFFLTYQELLKRKNGRYEHIININPGEPIRDLSVEVFIEESSKLINLEVPPLRSGTQMASGNVNLDPKPDIKLISDSSAAIRFSPNIERQKQFARLMNTPEDNGLAAQFVIQYDVESDSNGGEMLAHKGYFINFFTPSRLAPISKHIVFLLDTSASMEGNKMVQLKEAMGQILDQLQVNDLFHLVNFGNGAKIWNLDKQSNNVLHSIDYNLRRKLNNPILNFPNAYPASPKYIAATKNCVNQFVPSGGTDALSALDAGLRLVEITAKEEVDGIYRQAVIIFLTDGYPNTRPETVITKITDLNKGLKKSSIFSILLGEDGNLDFLQKLSLLNNGTAKHIYDSADSAKQLEKFYDEIASPMLLNISVNYDLSQCPNITKTDFSALYNGSEIVVAGKCGDSKTVRAPEINAISSNGPVKMRPVVKNSLTDISRIWAYVTVKELLDRKKISNGNTNAIDKKIVDLSLNYSFVTGLSSMVVTNSHNDVVVGSQELQNPLGSHPTASAPNPNYVRPTSTTTAATPTTTPTPTVESQIKALFEAFPWLKKLLNESAVQLKLAEGSNKLDPNRTSVLNVFEFSIQARMSAIQTPK